MQCSKCNCSLSIARSHIEFENDDNPITPTKAYNVLELSCTNPKCIDYSKDLNNPTIVETLRQSMN